MIKVSLKDTVRCQWCQADALAKEWNDGTFAACTSRELRRDFRPITYSKAWKRNAEFYYKCPNCGAWSRGDQLLVIDKDGKPVRGIGGSPLIIENKHGKNNV